MDIMNLENKISTAVGTYLGLPERRKFLIVEDDSAAIPIWDKIIKTVDPKAIIRWATSEEAAEDMIRERANLGDTFDFIIADIFLAGPKTGVDLWKRFGGGKMQFLFTSSITRKKFLEMIGELRNEYPLLIRKPFQIRQCIDSLFALLQSKKVIGVGRSH